jgi:uncharacterized protein YkwD
VLANVALLALSLYANPAGPVNQNPVKSAPPAQLVSYVPAPPASPANSAGFRIAELSTARMRVIEAALPPANHLHVSVGDYTTQAKMGAMALSGISIPTEGDETVVLSADEAALLNDLNQERTSRGLNSLDIDPRLVLIAREHSEDMCRRNYFDHLAPEPGPVTPMDRYLASLGTRPDYAMVGENIYYRSLTDGIIQSATEANDAFMHSPGHRANVLQPLYTKIGIGIYRDQAGEFWVTEMFLTDSPPPK